MFGIGRAMGAFLLLSSVLACNPVDEQAARIEASRRFSDYVSTFQIDPVVFEGPRVVDPPAGVPFGFEWRYSDAQGKVSFFVWVESSGWSNVAIEGDIERLKANPKQSVAG